MIYTRSLSNTDAAAMGANSDLNHDLGPGRRIINVGPTDSKLFGQRSARPGDPGFDQNFGSETFARDTMGGELLRDRTPAGSSLRGGMGKPIDTSGDAFANVAQMAKQVEFEAYTDN